MGGKRGMGGGAFLLWLQSLCYKTKKKKTKTSINFLFLPFSDEHKILDNLANLLYTSHSDFHLHHAHLYEHFAAQNRQNDCFFLKLRDKNSGASSY